jgi:hypothetical protein
MILSAPGAQPRDRGLILSAVRFYRAKQQQTRITAFVQIPLAFMQPTPPDAGGQLSYQVSVEVADSSRVPIAPEQVWRSHARADIAERGAYAMEMLEFAVVSGHYWLEVVVRDSVSGREVKGGSNWRGFRKGRKSPISCSRPECASPRMETACRGPESCAVAVSLSQRRRISS